MDKKNIRPKLRKSSTQKESIIIRKRPRLRPHSAQTPAPVAAPVKPTEKKEKKKKRVTSAAPPKKPNAAPVAAPPKKLKIDPETVAKIHPLVREILPKKMPYKIRIHADIYDHLKDQPDISNKALLKGIKVVLRQIISKYRYQSSIAYAKYRHGLEGDKTEISDDHRKAAKKNCWMMKKKRIDRKLKQN